MRTSHLTFWFRSVVVAAAVMVGLLTLASNASAFGNFRLKTNSMEEADGRWKFDVECDYGSKPHLGHIPFDFVFVQKVYYEYSITDNDAKPVQRPKPMHNQPPQREQMDIGFADARGDIWQKTKFSFSLRRDRGFSAGEYSLTVKRTSDGATMGRPMEVILNGKNPLVDRRSIVFSGKKKEENKDKDKDKADKTDKATSESAEDPGKAKPNEGSDTERGEGMPGEPETEEPMDTSFADGPPPVEPNRGCGCRVAGVPSSGGAASLLSIASVVLLFCRRRSNWNRSRG